MKRRLGYFALAIAALSVSTACRVDDGPQESSGSHWLSCKSDAECERYVEDASCDERYCEDAEGVRLIAEDFTTVSPGLVESTTTDSSVTSAESVATAETTEGDATESAPVGAGGTAPEPSSSEGGASSNGGVSSAPSASIAPPECSPLPALLPTENIYEGDYVVTGITSVEAAALLTEISGNLTFGQRASDDFSEVELPGLVRIGGSLRAEDSAVTSLLLPNLKSLGADLLLTGNAELLTADFRSLESVAGGVVVSENSRLEALELDALVTVNGNFEIGASVLANCQVQSVQGALGLSQNYSSGRADCECVMMCERLSALCP